MGNNDARDKLEKRIKDHAESKGQSITQSEISKKAAQIQEDTHKRNTHIK
jgi:hypothetical protein